MRAHVLMVCWHLVLLVNMSEIILSPVDAVDKSSSCVAGTKPLHIALLEVRTDQMIDVVVQKKRRQLISAEGFRLFILFASVVEKDRLECSNLFSRAAGCTFS